MDRLSLRQSFTVLFPTLNSAHIFATDSPLSIRFSTFKRVSIETTIRLRFALIGKAGYVRAYPQQKQTKLIKTTSTYVCTQFIERLPSGNPSYRPESPRRAGEFLGVRLL